MNYITVKEAAAKWNITIRTVQSYCINDRIPGTKHIGKQWLIPQDASRPQDGRHRDAKKQLDLIPYHFPLFVNSTYYSNSTVLSEEESRLLNAELLHLKGKDVEAIIECKKILEDAISTHVIFGCNCIIGYSSIYIGSVSQYDSAVANMKKIIENETLHKEDYSLILQGLLYHVSLDCTGILTINPLELSSEALLYYQFMIVTSYATTFVTKDISDINLIISQVRSIEFEGITPLAALMYYLVGILLQRINKQEEAMQYFQVATDISLSNNLYNIPAKYYSINFNEINQCMEKHSAAQFQTLQKFHKKSINNWPLVYKLSHKIAPSEEIPLKEAEILVLYSNKIPTISIANILGYEEKEVKKAIKHIKEVCKTDSLESVLEKYRN